MLHNRANHFQLHEIFVRIQKSAVRIFFGSNWCIIKSLNPFYISFLFFFLFITNSIQFDCKYSKFGRAKETNANEKKNWAIASMSLPKWSNKHLIESTWIGHTDSKISNEKGNEFETKKKKEIMKWKKKKEEAIQGKTPKKNTQRNRNDFEIVYALVYVWCIELKFILVYFLANDLNTNMMTNKNS